MSINFEKMMRQIKKIQFFNIKVILIEHSNFIQTLNQKLFHYLIPLLLLRSWRTNLTQFLDRETKFTEIGLFLNLLYWICKTQSQFLQDSHTVRLHVFFVKSQCSFQSFEKKEIWQASNFTFLSIFEKGQYLFNKKSPFRNLNPRVTKLFPTRKENIFTYILLIFQQILSHNFNIIGWNRRR